MAVSAGMGQFHHTAFRFSELKEGIAFGRTQYPSLGLFSYDDGSVSIIRSPYDQERDARYEAQWENVAQLAAAGDDIVGLTRDAAVLWSEDSPNQRIYQQWDDIVAIYGYNNVFGLRADGTVVAAGRDAWGEMEVGIWEDIVCVSPAKFFTVGLRRNGTVVATGSNQYGQCDTSDWKDMVAIATGSGTSGSTYTLGIGRWGEVWVSGDTDIGIMEHHPWVDLYLNASLTTRPTPPSPVGRACV